VIIYLNLSLFWLHVSDVKDYVSLNLLWASVFVRIRLGTARLGTNNENLIDASLVLREATDAYTPVNNSDFSQGRLIRAGILAISVFFEFICLIKLDFVYSASFV
jgi:hypothetical protein